MITGPAPPEESDPLLPVIAAQQSLTFLRPFPYSACLESVLEKGCALDTPSVKDLLWIWLSVLCTNRAPVRAVAPCDAKRCCRRSNAALLKHDTKDRFRRAVPSRRPSGRWQAFRAGGTAGGGAATAGGELAQRTGGLAQQQSGWQAPAPWWSRGRWLTECICSVPRLRARL